MRTKLKREIISELRKYDIAWNIIPGSKHNKVYIGNALIAVFTRDPKDGKDAKNIINLIRKHVAHENHMEHGGISSTGRKAAYR